MKLSIIVPAYNEEKTIREILSRVKKVKLPKDVAREIIVIDDNSSDSTGKILATIKGVKVIRHKRNMGKGAAVRTGIKNAAGDIFLIQDADLEYNPEDYSRLLEPIIQGKADVVYGTRLANYPFRLWGKNKTPMPLHYVANRFLSFLTNLLYGGNVTDMETCYKVFTKDVIRNLKLKSDKFDIEPEITAKVLKNGYKVFEVPIKVKPRGYNEGKKISWVDGIVALWTLLKYRFVD